MGPSGEVELSEADADALTDLKGAAAAAASEEKWDDAIAGFTKAIKACPLPRLSPHNSCQITASLFSGPVQRTRNSRSGGGGCPACGRRADGSGPI